MDASLLGGAAERLLPLMFDAADVMAGAFEVGETDYRYLFVNSSTAAFYGLTPQQMVGASGADLGLSRAQVDTRLGTLRKCWDQQRALRVEYVFTHGGRTAWYLGSFSPLPGSTPRVGFVLVDITARKAAEAAVAEERQKLQVALDATQLGLWDYDVAADQVTWDDRVRSMFGVGADTAIDFAFYAARLHPDDADAVHTAFRDALAGVGGGSYAAEHRTADGARWLRASGQVIFDSAGEPVRVIGTARDITLEVKAREQERLLLAELNHRVKNNLATVQSLAMQTARRAADLPSFLSTFEGRLVSLARTHDVLTANAWAEAALRDVLARELAAYADRVEIHGPDVSLASTQALAMGLIAHELTTNAVKYGALSGAAGRVNVAWARSGDRICFRWRETGGPVTEPPAQTGFGTRLIARLAAGDLRGTLDVTYAADGLRLEIAFPAAAQP